MNIAEIIRSRRVTLGLTQSALGELVGVSQGKIGDWERGTQSPSYESIEKLAATLGPITIGEDMKTFFSTDSVVVERGESGAVVITDGGGVYSFPTAGGALEFAERMVSTGYGEWWASEYEAIVRVLA